MNKTAFVYFMTNWNNDVLYVGVTSNLEKRVWEHKQKVYSECFTAKYNCSKLVYFEDTSEMKVAIVKEKQIKNWPREWKDNLINKQNPEWVDLSLGWYESQAADCGLRRNDGSSL